MELEPGWPCSGPLLRLAERFTQKLIPAFKSSTGMPYGTINLRLFYLSPIISKVEESGKNQYSSVFFFLQRNLDFKLFSVWTGKPIRCAIPKVLQICLL